MMTDPNPSRLAAFILENLSRKSGWAECEGLVSMKNVFYYLWDYRFKDGVEYKTKLEQQDPSNSSPILMAMVLCKVGDRWYYNKSVETERRGNPWWKQTTELMLEGLDAKQSKSFKPVNLGAMMFAPDEKILEMVWGVRKPDVGLMSTFARKWIGDEISWSFPEEDKADWYKFQAYLNVISPPEL